MKNYHPHPVLNLILWIVAETAVSGALIYNGLRDRGINGIVDMIHFRFNAQGDFTLQDASLVAGIMFLLLRAVYIVRGGGKSASKD